MFGEVAYVTGRACGLYEGKVRRVTPRIRQQAVIEGGRSSKFFKSQSLHRETKTSTTMSLRVQRSRLVFGEVQPPQTLALPRPAAASLQGELAHKNLL